MVLKEQEMRIILSQSVLVRREGETKSFVSLSIQSAGTNSFVLLEPAEFRTAVTSVSQ